MHIIIRAGSRDRRNIPGVVCYFLRTFAPLVFENRIFENRNAKLWQGCSLQKMPRNDEVFFPRVFSFSYTSRGAFFFFGGDLSPTLTTTEARKKKTEKATLFVGIAMKRKSHLFVAIAMKNNPCQISSHKSSTKFGRVVLYKYQQTKRCGCCFLLLRRVDLTFLGGFFANFGLD